VKRVLVFLGGADPENITGMAMEALSDPELLHLEVDVVIGSQNPHRGKIEKLVQSRPKTTLHIQATNMAQLMCAADVAIGAGGSTTWERLSLGLPSIIIPIAKNQIPIALGINEVGCGIVIGDKITASIIGREIGRILGKKKHLNMSYKCLGITDGNGAERVADMLKI
jgi:spore coat polysaccharide biosynthesis predicted glycosyltransferase SpsG